MSEALFDERTKVCPECEGDGWLRPRFREITFLRMSIYPIRPISLSMQCPTCRGAGYVRAKVEAA